MTATFQLRYWTPQRGFIDNPASTSTLALDLNAANWELQKDSLRFGIVNDGNPDRIVESKASFMHTGTVAAALADIRTLQRLLTLDAPEHTKYTFARRVVWFFRPHADGKLLMTQLVGGRLEYDPKQFDTHMLHPTPQFKIHLTFRHRNYFEDTTATTLTAYNGRTGNAMSGNVVWYSTKGYTFLSGGTGDGHVNAVRINAADILGDLPAPLYLSMFASVADAAVHIGSMPESYDEGATGNLTLEAEAATRDGTVASGSATNRTNASGVSAGQTVAVTNVPATYTKLFDWSITPGNSFNYPLRMFLLFWHAATPNADFEAYVVIRANLVNAPETTSQIVTIPSGSATADLGIITPPKLTSGNLRVELWCKHNAATADFELDALQFLPAWSYGRVRNRDTASGYQYEGANYPEFIENSVPLPMRGRGLWLYPNRTNTLMRFIQFSGAAHGSFHSPSRTLASTSVLTRFRYQTL